MSEKVSNKPKINPQEHAIYQYLSSAFIKMGEEKKRKNTDKNEIY